MHWWNQFPAPLRRITQVRLLTSLGSGGIIYWTPLVFNQLDFSATQIGTGIAAAALTGTISRLASGWLLDKGIRYSSLLKCTAIFAILADLTLFQAQSYEAYLKGQLLLGLAVGLYWPSVEIAVPLCCEEFPSSKGYALVRSSDALGICLGALFGILAAWSGNIRLIYILEICCMLILLSLLAVRALPDRRADLIHKIERNHSNSPERQTLQWLPVIIPVLTISLLSTAIFALLQSALPLDLVHGGLARPPISEEWSGALIALQLILLMGFQWPIGSWLATQNIKFGLSLSLRSFGMGCLMLSLSTLWSGGITIIVIAQLPLAFGLASFLPTATEAIIQSTPLENRGVAMALFSQCFAISAFLAPILAGRMLDTQGNGLLLWLIMSGSCFATLPLIKSIKSVF